MVGGQQELSEKGLKTLVLDRWRMAKHLKDYPTESKSRELPFADELPPKKKDIYYVQSKTSYAVKQSTTFFVQIMFNIYQKKPFLWTRGYQVGGRSLMWGRWAYRRGDVEF